MTDHSTIDMTTTSNFVRALSEKSEQLEQLSRDADSMTWQPNPGIVVLGAVIGVAMLAHVFMMSRNYAIQEQRELAEAERIQTAADMKEFENMEKCRSNISRIVASYAIHLTNMTSALSPSSRHDTAGRISSDKSSSKRQIPDGNDGDGDCDGDNIPIESITISSSSEEDIGDIEESRDDGDDDEELTSENACTAYETLRSTLTIDAAENTPPVSSSSSIASTMTRAKMREAVTDNPCSICLEPFKAGDDVVVCSNNHDGRTPHVFHQACSLDYILNHPDKMQAPCPCCRNVLLPSEEQQRKMGCFRNSHRSALTLPELDEV